MWFRVVALAGLASLMAGCTGRLAEQALLAQEALIGLERTELLSCAGVPERARVEGDTEFFTYHSEQIRGFGGGFYGSGVFSRGYGFRRGSFAVPAGADFSSTYCEATFVLVDGLVTRVNYVGASGVGRARFAQCAFIVQSCLAQMADTLPSDD